MQTLPSTIYSEQNVIAHCLKNPLPPTPELHDQQAAQATFAGDPAEQNMYRHHFTRGSPAQSTEFRLNPSDEIRA
ncbi:hypothetical protein [uncultured Spongiibacter sp.]|uniref:hypothetical protein n=1 Tax=uncultured Spongiibacter sp. TaxID=870896 RepID=UPI00258DC370|nr:hypothetical protein [uncultured Spongiibacter sp.]